MNGMLLDLFFPEAAATPPVPAPAATRGSEDRVPRRPRRVLVVDPDEEAALALYAAGAIDVVTFIRLAHRRH